MAGYREIKVWQQGMEITREIYKLTAGFSKDELYGVTSQIRCCAVSIPSNIAEGHSRDSPRELTRFVSIAKGSLAELETQLLIAKELEYGDASFIESLLTFAEQESRMLTGLRHSLTKN